MSVTVRKEIPSISLAAAVFALATALSLAACTKQKPAETILRQSDIAAEAQQAKLLKAEGKVAEGEAKAKEAAEKYARMGELLLMPEGVQYADEMFALALELDPKNGKALFYKAGTEPLMTARGFITRVERVITDEEALADIEKLRGKIAEYKRPEVTQFAHSLPAGERPFITYYDGQRFAREKLLPALLASVEKLDRIDTTQPLKLNVVPDRFKLDPVRRSSYYHNSYTYCSSDPVTGWNCNYSHYEGEWSDQKFRSEYFIDKHDLKALKSAMMGMVDQVRLATAYSLRDSEYAIRRLQALNRIRHGHMSAKDVTSVMLEFHEIFTLEKDNQLAEIIGNSSAALKNALELDDMKSDLCESKERDETNSVIFPICMTAETVDALKVSLDFLNGPKKVKLYVEDGTLRTTAVMDIGRLLKNPPKDLKALLPTKFDKHGEPVVYPDPTFGGLFPNGDIIDKLKEVSRGEHSVNQWARKFSRSVDRMVDHLD